jgi:hypothetical protein
MKAFAFEVISLTVIITSEMGATPILQSSNSQGPMSALGQKQT